LSCAAYPPPSAFRGPLLQEPSVLALSLFPSFDLSSLSFFKNPGLPSQSEVTQPSHSKISACHLLFTLFLPFPICPFFDSSTRRPLLSTAPGCSRDPFSPALPELRSPPPYSVAYAFPESGLFAHQRRPCLSLFFSSSIEEE